MTITGRAIIYGIRPIKPIINAPEGAKVRVRLRADDVGRVPTFRHENCLAEWVYAPNIGRYFGTREFITFVKC